MCEQNLEIIKTRDIFLKNGEKSDVVLLKDPEGVVDMHFTFCLKYVGDNVQTQTHYKVADKSSADFIIETRPNSYTELKQPFRIGTFGKEEKGLFINFKVYPCDESNTHHMYLSFLTSK
jgi:hypothetical protein